ncbi:MAG TPA: D-glycero-beta-D-manno-heptose 1-phosphate adenylyltransferase, partial [Alphaproteobacteria bacterium]|nr:D-glycero-beta-D-manno-heptose 1-phosphate adenylyltransferase [Alphaproteobacteria bacterium]
ALGGSACLISVVGDDAAGRQLTAMVGAQPRVEPYLLVEPARPSTVKTRFIAGGQQLLRADTETTDGLGARAQQSLLRLATDSLTAWDALVLSDYGKGVLTKEVLSVLIARARAAERPIVVDPKGRDFLRYRGATVLTPNRRELAEATGRAAESEEEIEAAARFLIGEAELAAVLVTRSERGMTLVARDTEAQHLPAHTRTVFDVSGAGDTVVATFGAALGRGVPWREAAELANLAASIVVGKSGTATAEAWELRQLIEAGDARATGKLLNRLELARQIEEWRGRGLKLGLTNGCFDLLHPGHVSLLRTAKAECDRLIVAINSDQSVRRLKGPDRPVQLEEARAEVLASLEMVDAVVVFDDDTPEALIAMIRPDVLVKGADYTEDRVVGGTFVKSYGGRVVLAPLSPQHSTTKTIQKITGA